MAINSISAVPIPPCCREPKAYSVSLPSNLKPHNLASSLIGSRLSIRQTNPNHRRLTVAAVSLSLPAEKPTTSPTEKLPKWSSRALKSISLAELEAGELKYPQTGTESLLLGILVEGTSNAAKVLRANGFTFYKVQEEALKLIGKTYPPYTSPVRPPLTGPAQKALDWAVDAKLKSGKSGEVTVTYLVLGIWSTKESAGHRIMASLGFDDEKAKELTESRDEDVVSSKLSRKEIMT